MKRECSLSITSAILRAHSSIEIFASGIVRKRALNQDKNTNVITCKTAGIFPYSQNFEAS